MGGRYDPQKSSKANKAALLRAVVAGYIAYLGYKIMQAEDTTMSLMTARLIGIAFIASAVAFGAYIFIRWRRDVSETVPAEEKETDDEV